MSLPRVVKNLGDPVLKRALATDRGILPIAQINRQTQKVTQAFDRMRKLRSYTALKALRDNVVAHHGRDLDSHGATNGALNRLMVRTVALVDAVSQLLEGETTDTQGIVRIIREEAMAFWDKGMEGVPAD